MREQLGDFFVELLLLGSGEEGLRHGGGVVEAQPQAVNENPSGCDGFGAL